MAHEPHDEREQIRSDERGEVEPGRSREHGVEDRRGEQPVDRRKRELGSRHRQTREVDPEAPQAERLPAPGDHSRVDADHRQEPEPDRAARGQLDPGQVDGQRPGRVNEAAEQEEPEPERQQGEGDDARDLLRPNAPAREHPVADTASAEEGEAHVVAEDVGHERGEGDAPVRESVADITEGQRVVARQGDVAEHGEDERERERPRRDVAHVCENVVQVVGLELVTQHEDGECQEDRAEKRPQGGQDSLLHGLPSPCASAPIGSAGADSTPKVGGMDISRLAAPVSRVPVHPPWTGGDR